MIIYLEARPTSGCILTTLCLLSISRRTSGMDYKSGDGRIAEQLLNAHHDVHRILSSRLANVKMLATMWEKVLNFITA